MPLFRLFVIFVDKTVLMSADELEMLLDDTEGQMRKAISHLESELTKIRAGKASPAMVEGVVVEYYGSTVPLSQVANINILDARTISIQPWEKKMLGTIEKAILQANIGITPQNDGNQIRLFLPPLTEERRRELVKKASAEGENSKIAIRNIRRDAIEYVKKMQKDGLSEDVAKDAESNIQEVTNRYIALIDKHLAAKEKDMMAV